MIEAYNKELKKTYEEKLSKNEEKKKKLTILNEKKASFTQTEESSNKYMPTIPEFYSPQLEKKETYKEEKVYIRQKPNIFQENNSKPFFPWLKEDTDLQLKLKKKQEWLNIIKDQIDEKEKAKKKIRKEKERKEKLDEVRVRKELEELREKYKKETMEELGISENALDIVKEPYKITYNEPNETWSHFT